MNEPPNDLYVLVDKRGTILEKGKFSRDAANPLPSETFWVNRASAKQQLDTIKGQMTIHTWATWLFKIKRYTKN